MSLPAVTQKNGKQLEVEFTKLSKSFLFLNLQSRWTVTKKQQLPTKLSATESKRKEGSDEEDKALTDDFNQLGDKDAVLQVVSHVVNQRQFRPLPQLRIHPGRVRL